MARLTIPETEARRVLGGGIVVLVTTAYHGSEDVAPVIWHTPLSVEPPLIGIAIHPSRHTHDMIKGSQQFAINVPKPSLARHVHYTGMVSGADMNKIESANLRTLKARKIDAPLLDNCLAWIECGLKDALEIGDHTLFIGEVASLSVESDAFDGVWKLDDPELRPLHYAGGPFYGTLSTRIEVDLNVEPEPEESDGPPPGEDRRD